MQLFHSSSTMRLFPRILSSVIQVFCFTKHAAPSQYFILNHPSLFVIKQTHQMVITSFHKAGLLCLSISLICLTPCFPILPDRQETPREEETNIA